MQLDASAAVLMNSDNSESGREQVHRGYNLETGVLARVREWTDVFPWVRLGRTMRVAGSPPMVLLAAAFYLVWWLGATRIFEDTFPRSIESVDHLSRWHFISGVGWSLFVWAPLALLLARQGALLTAGRTMAGLKPGVAHAIRRTPGAWIAAVVPLACVLAIGLLIVVVGWVARVVEGIIMLEALLGLVAAMIAIPCGILAFGACVAVPLSWAALSNERDPDPLDSLSRGYESLFRRPVQLSLYIVLATGILSVVGLLAVGVGSAASMVAANMLRLSGCPPTVLLIVNQLLQSFPVVVVITQLWSLVGGIYLLLRYDTGGQEVEDLWQPSPSSRPPLPEIPPQ